MTKQIRLAAGHHAAQPGQFDHNIGLTITLAQQAAAMGAQLIVLPEMNLCGFEVEVDWRDLVISADHPMFGQLQQAAGDLKIAIAAGYIERHAQGISINHTVFRPDGSREFQRKSGGPGGPEQGCVSTMSRTIVHLGDLRLGIIICADGGHPSLWQLLREQRANVIAWPTAGSDYWVAHVEDADLSQWDASSLLGAHARRNCQAKAQEMGCPLLVSNLAGRTPHLAWPGNSGIIDAQGCICAWLPEEAIVTRMKPALVVAEVEINASRVCITL